jgi:cyclic-di-GMP-binding protein
MASDHSFDVVCQLDKPEIANAVQQALREADQRYDFKQAKYGIDFKTEDMILTIKADSDFRLKNLVDILETRMAKRQIPLAAITRDPVDVSSGGGARQVFHLQKGIPADKAREIVKRIKDLKLKIQATIQQDQVRISGKVLDDLQSAQKVIREAKLDIHVQFVNYR